jgi:hypothetical protein
MAAVTKSRTKTAKFRLDTFRRRVSVACGIRTGRRVISHGQATATS